MKKRWDNTEKIIFEDEQFEVFLVGNSRAEGHVAISTKKHFKDMLEADDEICKEIFVLAKREMNALKEVYQAESVKISIKENRKAVWWKKGKIWK